MEKGKIQTSNEKKTKYIYGKTKHIFKGKKIFTYFTAGFICLHIRG